MFFKKKALSLRDDTEIFVDETLWRLRFAMTKYEKCQGEWVSVQMKQDRPWVDNWWHWVMGI